MFPTLCAGADGVAIYRCVSKGADDESNKYGRLPNGMKLLPAAMPDKKGLSDASNAAIQQLVVDEEKARRARKLANSTAWTRGAYSELKKRLVLHLPFLRGARRLKDHNAPAPAHNDLYGTNARRLNLQAHLFGTGAGHGGGRGGGGGGLHSSSILLNLSRFCH